MNRRCFSKRLHQWFPYVIIQGWIDSMITLIPSLCLFISTKFHWKFFHIFQRQIEQLIFVKFWPQLIRFSPSFLTYPLFKLIHTWTIKLCKCLEYYSLLLIFSLSFWRSSLLSSSINSCLACILTIRCLLMTDDF